MPESGPMASQSELLSRLAAGRHGLGQSIAAVAMTWQLQVHEVAARVDSDGRTGTALTVTGHDTDTQVNTNRRRARHGNLAASSGRDP